MTLELEVNIGNHGLGRLLGMLSEVNADVEDVSRGTKRRFRISPNGSGLDEDRLYAEIDRFLQGIQGGVSSYHLRNGSKSVVYARIV